MSAKTTKKSSATTKAKKADDTSHFGAISMDAAYPLALFQRLAGLKKASIAEAKQKGLRVIRVGNRRFVRGCDFHKFLATLVAQNKPGEKLSSLLAQDIE
jgi:hypothetical protein